MLGGGGCKAGLPQVHVNGCWGLHPSGLLSPHSAPPPSPHPAQAPAHQEWPSLLTSTHPPPALFFLSFYSCFLPSPAQVKFKNLRIMNGNSKNGFGGAIEVSGPVDLTFINCEFGGSQSECSAVQAWCWVVG